MDAGIIIHHMFCGAVAAAGFGVLFNVGPRSLPWCAASGALALLIRTTCLGLGWNLEAASFVAALGVGTAGHLLRTQAGVWQGALDVVGCIPMIPGSFAAKAILGLFALASVDTANPSDTMIVAVQYALRVVFTIGAMGTGLAIPTLLLRVGRKPPNGKTF